MPVKASVGEPVIGGDADLAEAVVAGEVDAPDETTRAAEDLPELTAEERRVLDMMGRGKPLGEIAAMLGVTQSTAKTRSGAVLERLRRASSASVPQVSDHGADASEQPILPRSSDREPSEADNLQSGL